MHHRGRSEVRLLTLLNLHPTYNQIDVLLNIDDKNIIDKAEYSQPICTALQIALVNLLATWSITPAAVVGHSSGEIAASYAVGALTMNEAIVAAYYRGYVCKSSQTNGGMAAIGIGKQEVSPYLVQGVQIACENSISSVTLSGDMDILEEFLSKIKRELPDVFVRKLQVGMAYHSREFCFEPSQVSANKDRSYDRCWRPLLRTHSKTSLSSLADDTILLKRQSEGPSYGFRFRS